MHRWGYIHSAKCAICQWTESMTHCFLTCPRVKEVWANYNQLISNILNYQFIPSFNTVFFLLFEHTSRKKKIIVGYLIKTILYGLWSFRNRATFRNGSDNAMAIINYITNDVKVRLHVDFHRLTEQQFEKT